MTTAEQFYSNCPEEDDAGWGSDEFDDDADEDFVHTGSNCPQPVDQSSQDSFYEQDFNVTNGLNQHNNVGEFNSSRHNQSNNRDANSQFAAARNFFYTGNTNDAMAPKSNLQKRNVVSPPVSNSCGLNPSQRQGYVNHKTQLAPTTSKPQVPQKTFNKKVPSPPGSLSDDDSDYEIHENENEPMPVKTFHAGLDRILSKKKEIIPVQKNDTAPVQKSNIVPVQKSNTAPFQKSNIVPVQKSNTAPFQKSNTAPFHKSNAAPFQKSNAAPFQKSNAAPFQKSNTIPVHNSSTIAVHSPPDDIYEVDSFYEVPANEKDVENCSNQYPNREVNLSNTSRHSNAKPSLPTTNPLIQSNEPVKSQVHPSNRFHNISSSYPNHTSNSPSISQKSGFNTSIDLSPSSQFNVRKAEKIPVLNPGVIGQGPTENYEVVQHVPAESTFRGNGAVEGRNQFLSPSEEIRPKLPYQTPVHVQADPTLLNKNATENLKTKGPNIDAAFNVSNPIVAEMMRSSLRKTPGTTEQRSWINDEQNGEKKFIGQTNNSSLSNAGKLQPGSSVFGTKVSQIHSGTKPAIPISPTPSRPLGRPCPLPPTGKKPHMVSVNVQPNSKPALPPTGPRAGGSLPKSDLPPTTTTPGLRPTAIKPGVPSPITKSGAISVLPTGLNHGSSSTNITPSHSNENIPVFNPPTKKSVVQKSHSLSNINPPDNTSKNRSNTIPTCAKTERKSNLSCVAMYAYDGSTEDGLPFSEGDVITVIDNVDPDWWYGSLNDKTGYFPKTYVTDVRVKEQPAIKKTTADLSQFSWYGYKMDRKTADLQLKHRNRNGYFIIRETDKGAGYSISLFCNGATTHLRVPFRDDGYFLGDSGKVKFPSVEAMVKHFSINPVFLKDGTKTFLAHD